jgi:hypothetical protein
MPSETVRFSGSQGSELAARLDTPAGPPRAYALFDDDRMYTAQKKWPLGQVTVDLRHDKVHAADCAECETREGKVDKIERVVGDPRTSRAPKSPPEARGEVKRGKL